MPKKIARYGWNKDSPDHRDFHYMVSPSVLQRLPPAVNLTGQNPPVYDQGDLGSCTSNAVAGALEFDQMKQLLSPFIPSRLFIYYNTRVLEGTPMTDSGASLRDTCKAIANDGYCNEVLWPYNPDAFASKPPYDDYLAAKPYNKIIYHRVTQTLSQMRGALASGIPFVFGISVYESFEQPLVLQTGIVPLPSPTEKLIGGHALLCVGYLDATQKFLFRNSWGAGYGTNGYGTIPYAYLMDPHLAGDFWIINHVSG